jgi:hypothetical protein
MEHPVPKPVSSTTNDGNIARRFLHSPSVSSSTTGIDEELMKQRWLSSGMLRCVVDVPEDSHLHTRRCENLKSHKLIKRFATFLRAMWSGYDIDTAALNIYAKESCA